MHGNCGRWRGPDGADHGAKSSIVEHSIRMTHLAKAQWDWTLNVLRWTCPLLQKDHPIIIVIVVGERPTRLSKRVGVK